MRMPGSRRNAGRAAAAEVVARARTIDAEDYNRRRVLAELRDIDIRTVFETAAGLIESGQRDSQVLGAQILDGVFTTRLLKARQFAPDGEMLLDDLCTPDQDPLVLSAALPPYLAIGAVTAELLLELLGHADARVRASACQLIAVELDTDPDDRIIEALFELLGKDPSEQVRGEAAGGLLLAYGIDERYQQQIADGLARYVDDPLPAVRVAAIQTTMSNDAERMLQRLIAELRDPQADWRFVQACLDRGFWEPASSETRAAAEQALLRLRDQDWPAHETPRRYPLADERADILAEAIKAVAP